MESDYPDIEHDIVAKQALDDALAQRLDRVIDSFKVNFKKEI
jgi:hypothetical protein